MQLDIRVSNEIVAVLFFYTGRVSINLQEKSNLTLHVYPNQATVKGVALFAFKYLTTAQNGLIQTDQPHQPSLNQYNLEEMLRANTTITEALTSYFRMNTFKIGNYQT